MFVRKKKNANGGSVSIQIINKSDGYKVAQTVGSARHPDETENYSQLWQIEKAFRISKTDLKIRPIHHYKQRRIEAHICVAFVAYAIYKELDHLLAKRKIKMSPKRATGLTHTMYALEYQLPSSCDYEQKILHMDEEQCSLYGAVWWQ